MKRRVSPLKLKPKTTHRPYIIPVFLPNAGCPHQCAFCNQTSITGNDQRLPLPEEIIKEIELFLSYKGSARSFTEISFYGGNFLGLDNKTILSYLKIAHSYVKCNQADGIRFSTRPDTITPDSLKILTPYPISTVELGVQSMNNEVLKKSKRGHTFQDTMSAVMLLKKTPYTLGLQLMTGLPGETDEQLLQTAQAIVNLRPDFVRIYPVLVIKDSLLAKWYQKGTYRPLTLEEAILKVKALHLIFKRVGIGVIRMGLQATDGLEQNGMILDGPYHPSFGHLVLERLFLDCACHLLKQVTFEKKTVTLLVNPSNISKMRGIKNRNIDRLKSKFNLIKINVLPDSDCNDRSIIVEKKVRGDIFDKGHQPLSAVAQSHRKT